MFAVEERERPGLLIGDLGVHDMHTDAREKGEERWGWRAGQAELGYLYREDRWGKGYGKEGLRAFLGEWWGLERRKVVVEVSEKDDGGERTVGEDEEGKLPELEEERRETLKAVTETANVASLNVLAHCGFDKVRTFVVATTGDELIEMEMKRP